MQDLNNVFNYQHLLCLVPGRRTSLGEKVERFVVQERKLWLVLNEDLAARVFLDIHDHLAALIKGSEIAYF